jgi:hypothetical protein
MGITSRTARGAVPSDVVLRRLRVPLVQRARLAHAGGAEDVFTFDLGLRGLFVERGEPLPAEAEVTVTFLLPGNELPVVARCRVAWWHAPDVPLLSKRLPAGVGLEFRDLGEAEERRIRAYLLDHLQGDPRARRFQRPWPSEEDLP